MYTEEPAVGRPNCILLCCCFDSKQNISMFHTTVSDAANIIRNGTSEREHVQLITASNITRPIFSLLFYSASRKSVAKSDC